MAGFNTAVTGLKAATTLLDVTGNNIANSSTVGFKASRTEFGDIYATAVVGAGSSNTPGSGVTVTDIAQDFSGGTIEFTNSNLDLAINGSGFFQLDDGNGNVSYTRAGSFELDKDGYIVSKSGKYLQGYGLDALGNQLPIQDLSVSQKESPPKATEMVGLSFNINSNEDATTLERVFNKTDPNSYTYSTTIGTFDSLGNENSIRFYFSEQAPVREKYQFDISDSAGSFTSTPRTISWNVSASTTSQGVDADASAVPPVPGSAEETTLSTTDGTAVLVAGDNITFNNIVYTAVGGEKVSDVFGKFAALDVNNLSGDFSYASGSAPTVNGSFSLSGNNLVFTAASVGNTPDLTVATAGTLEVALSEVQFGGLEMSTTSALAGGDEASNVLYWDDTGNGPWSLTQESQDKLALLDPRIDVNTFKMNADGTIAFEVKAEYTQYGGFDVSVNSAKQANSLVGDATERPANEVQSFTLDESQFNTPDTNQNLTLGEARQINVAGVSIPLADTLTLEQAGETIASYEQEIIDANPDIASVEFDTASNKIVVTWKADAGDIDDKLTVLATDGTNPFVLSADGTTTAVTEEASGDNSYIGSYRMYAFLNDSEQLNIGREPDPGTGTGAADETEVGPIMVGFNSTTGVLESVNGADVSSAGQAPNITILGADPANPNDTKLASDVDGLVGIQLDISGSSQFASQSIVKSQSQDGYAKGDLIGVSFAGTGEMVASFSNGQRQNLGLVAVATFENQDGLQPSGDTEWTATLTSGNAILNPPGTGLNGTLRSAALEQSNVDLSAELVKLIEGQRNFQANSKTLETLNTITQSILQI